MSVLSGVVSFAAVRARVAFHRHPFLLHCIFLDFASFNILIGGVLKHLF